MSIDIKELYLMSKDLKLLYVEDDANTRKTTLDFLLNFFQDITVAVDGQDALNKFNTKEFDLILSDINMPNLNGLEMIKIIRETNENMPILMLSAHNDSKYFLQAIELDVDGYILKPLIYRQFLKVIYKLVKKIRAFAIAKDYQKNLESELQERNEEIIHKLHFDDLTNLLSRYSFF